MIWFWSVALVLDFAHTVSPMALVCSHRGLRGIAIGRWRRCIALPVILFLVAAGVGLAFQAHWRAVAEIYWLWNAYHFGMQNFGLARLWSVPGPRWLHKVVIGGGTATIMLLGLPQPLGFIVGTIMVSFGHWLAELWLTWQVASYRLLFLASVLVAGCLAFLWDVPTAHGLKFHASGLFLTLYICRLGAGFVHFSTDAWIWKMSDPQVRAVVGPRLWSAA